MFYLQETAESCPQQHNKTNHTNETENKKNTAGIYSRNYINPLNPELNPICYLLALLGAYHFLHVRIRVNP